MTDHSESKITNAASGLTASTRVEADSHRAIGDSATEQSVSAATIEGMPRDGRPQAERATHRRSGTLERAEGRSSVDVVAGLARTVWTPLAGHALATMALTALALAGVIRVAVFADEADNVLGACLMARGSSIYRDFFSHHFPLPYYALSLLGESGACSVLAGRALGGSLLILAGVVFGWVTRSRLIAPAMLVVALASPAYYLQLYLAETFVSAGLILGLGALTARGRRLRGLAGHGLRFAAVLTLAWSSPVGLMMAVPVVLLLVLGARGSRLAVGGVCLVALLSFPAVLAGQGILGPFVEQAVLFNVRVYSKYLGMDLTSPSALLWSTLTFARHRFSFVVDTIVKQDAKATIATYTAALEFALLAAFVAALARAPGERPFRLAAGLLLPLVVARDGFHLAPFVPLAAFVGAHLMPTAFGRSGAARLVGLLILVLAMRAYLFSLPLQWDAADALAESIRPDRRIAERTNPGDAVLYLPIAPHGYLAQDRRPGSFYAFFLPWQADLPGAEDRVIADIEANKVAVIFMDQDTPVWDEYRLREYAPRLHGYILSRFHPIDHRDPRRARIFARDDPSP